MVPDFSPMMLRFFLQVRVGHANRTSFKPGHDVIKAERRAIRNRAGVTSTEFEFAWHGRLRRAAPRLKLWAALGLVPGDFGVMLTDDGGQEQVQ